MAKILIVDDDVSVSDSLKRFLTLINHKVFTAQNGREGLVSFQKEHQEIVLVDINMPGMNGIEVLKELKKESTKTEIIMTTGYANTDNAIKALNEGAFRYLTKPVQLEELQFEIQNVLEKQKLQEKLESQNQLLSNLSHAIAYTSTIVMLTDTKGKIEYVNPTFTQLTGYSLKEVIGKNPRFLKSGEMSQDEYKKLWERITSGNDWKGEFHNKKKNGELFWERAIISPVKNEKGVVTHYIAVKEDITKHKMTKKIIENQKQQLIQADKMVSLGTMAAGVAHEINNPLNVAIGDVHLIRRDTRDLLDFINQFSKISLPPDTLKEIERLKMDMDLPYMIENFDKKISRCEDAMERIKEIVQNLKYFSHLDNSEIVDVNINKSIESTIRMVPKKYKHDIEIKTEFGSLPNVPCYGRQINQVFLNIVVNALNAMEEKGELKIETLSDDKYIYIKFCDTGPGIPEDKIKKIFDPFYTTKPVGEGTGLGLSISYSIIDKHGGEITAVNNVDKGITFTVKLLKEGLKSS